MPGEQLTLSNDPYNSERAVLSIQDIYIKQEQAEAKNNNDVLILSDMDNMNGINMSSEGVQEFHLTDVGEDIISSSDNICMNMGAIQQIPDFNKMPIELTVPCKSDVKIERSHFVKYIIRDGKHIKVWECGICAKEFGHQYTLMRHLPTHTDERKFQCNTCGKAFRQMSTLSQHRAIHSAERPYVCEICRKTFNRVSTLISHRKTHNGHKPHRCHLCSKAFHQKGNLRNHVFTHTNERPYKCDVCNKGFNQMSNLMCHKLKAHQRSDKPRYVCQMCGKDFPKRMALRNHEQYQHGVNITADALQLLPEPPALSHCTQQGGSLSNMGGMGGPSATSTCTSATAASSSSAAGGLQQQQPQQQQQTQQQAGSKVRYTNGVIVEPINTEAMKLAIRSGQKPFALLRPLNGIPVLVRVLPAGEKQMLVPATAEDLRRHGQITITATQDQAASGGGGATTTTTTGGGGTSEDVNGAGGGGDAQPSTSGTNSTNGSTVQIKIPVVATVVQRCTNDGSLCMAVQSPGPKETVGDGYVIAQTDQDGQQTISEPIIKNQDMSCSMNFENIAQEIQYLDEEGNIITEEEYHAKSQLIGYSSRTEFHFPGDPSYIAHPLTNENGIMVPPAQDLTINTSDLSTSENMDININLNMNMNMNQLNSQFFEVNNELNELDDMIEQKPNINDFDTGMGLNVTDDSLTIYGEAANLLYGSDATFML